MKNRIQRRFYFPFFHLRAARCLWLVWFLLVPHCVAGPVRVTTWNLETSDAATADGGAVKTEAERIQDAAAALKKLNPDVIILQQVSGWEACSQLVQALKPAQFNVEICSLFRDTPASLPSLRQTAILSKVSSYFSESDSWRTDDDKTNNTGGFAFAAITFGDRNVGVFSVQMGDASEAREAAARQLLAQIDSFRQWEANRIDDTVLAGCFKTDPEDAREKTLRILEQAGFTNVFQNASLAQRTTRPGFGWHVAATEDYIFAQGAGFIGHPQIMASQVSEHYPVTSELDLNPGKPPVVSVARVAKPAAKPPAPVAKPVAPPADEWNMQWLLAQTSRLNKDNRLWWLVAALTGVLTLISAVRWLVRRRAMLAAANHDRIDDVSPASDGTRVLISPQTATGTVASGPFTNPPALHIRLSGARQEQYEEWRRRALAAERRAEQAQAVVRTGLLTHLSHWLKERLLQRLVSDRAQLLEVQRAATLKVMAVEERLSRIELQIQQQNQAYERRIEELTRELLMTREENRELIRARIAAIKVEMEAAQARMLQQAAMEFPKATSPGFESGTMR